MRSPSSIREGPRGTDYDGKELDQFYLLQQDYRTASGRKHLIQENTSPGRWRVILLGECTFGTRLFNGFALIIERCEGHWTKVGKLMFRTQHGLFEAEMEHFELHRGHTYQCIYLEFVYTQLQRTRLTR